MVKYPIRNVSDSADGNSSDFSQVSISSNSHKPSREPSPPDSDEERKEAQKAVQHTHLTTDPTYNDFQKNFISRISQQANAGENNDAPASIKQEEVIAPAQPVNQHPLNPLFERLNRMNYWLIAGKVLLVAVPLILFFTVPGLGQLLMGVAVLAKAMTFITSLRLAFQILTAVSIGIAALSFQAVLASTMNFIGNVPRMITAFFLDGMSHAFHENILEKKKKKEPQKEVLQQDAPKLEEKAAEYEAGKPEFVPAAGAPTAPIDISKPPSALIVPPSFSSTARTTKALGNTVVESFSPPLPSPPPPLVRQPENDHSSFSLPPPPGDDLIYHNVPARPPTP